MKTISIPNSVQLNFDVINYILNNVALVPPQDEDSEVCFDFNENTWLSSEMTTFLGIIFRDLQMNNYTVYVTGFSYKLSNLLKKNGFLSHFKLSENIPDTYGTTIPFIELRPEQTKTLDEYLNNILFTKMDEKINLSENEIIKSAIYELTHNIKEHSRAGLFFMCGQFFPQKNELTFSIADAGISIPDNIIECNGPQFNCKSQYIDWATNKGTTTKTNSVGGLGLYDIKENLRPIGDLKILSGNGYAEFNSNKNVFLKDTKNRFNGTMIYLKYDLNAILNIPTQINDSENEFFQF